MYEPAPDKKSTHVLSRTFKCQYLALVKFSYILLTFPEESSCELSWDTAEFSSVGPDAARPEQDGDAEDKMKMLIGFLWVPRMVKNWFQQSVEAILKLRKFTLEWVTLWFWNNISSIPRRSFIEYWMLTIARSFLSRQVLDDDAKALCF